MVMFDHSYLVEASAQIVLSRPERMIDNSMIDYVYEPSPQVPVDEEGYVQAFYVNEVQNIQQFWDKFGFVVIRECLTTEECTLSEKEAWDFIERHHPEIKRNDSHSWESWPSLKQLGILGDIPVLSPRLFANRFKPEIHSAFAQVFGTEKLWVSIGRLSMMRPTRGVPMKRICSKEQTESISDADCKQAEFELVDKPEWRTVSNWLHWDQNPWTGRTTTYGFRFKSIDANKGYQVKTQGILALRDCGPCDGGFHAVPGFHNKIRGWAHANRHLFNPNSMDTTIQVPAEDPIRNDVKRLPIRAGSLLIWHSALPHGTFPNDSNRGRLIQYIRMARADDEATQPWFPKHLLPHGLSVTPLAEHLLGWKSWDENSFSELLTRLGLSRFGNLFG